jgi:predicted DNA-binding transcriptional regulator YafY
VREHQNRANTSTRLLSLLQTHRCWTGTELAERREASVRTLRRDIDVRRPLGMDLNNGDDRLALRLGLKATRLL